MKSEMPLDGAHDVGVKDAVCADGHQEHDLNMKNIKSTDRRIRIIVGVVVILLLGVSITCIIVLLRRRGRGTIGERSEGKDP